MLIIWINGPFGVGKTTISNELHRWITDSYIYDPEMAGEFIWNNSPECMRRKGDFQDISLWRDFNLSMLKYIYENYSGTIIVPMTLVNKKYYKEIIGRLVSDGIEIHHYILLAKKSTLLDRQLKRGEKEGSWVSKQIDRCLASFENEVKGKKILTDNLSKEEIVDIILRDSCIKEGTNG